MFAFALLVSSFLQTAHAPAHHVRPHAAHVAHERINVGKRAWAFAGYGASPEAGQ